MTGSRTRMARNELEASRAALERRARVEASIKASGLTGLPGLPGLTGLIGLNEFENSDGMSLSTLPKRSATITKTKLLQLFLAISGGFSGSHPIRRDQARADIDVDLTVRRNKSIFLDDRPSARFTPSPGAGPFRCTGQFPVVSVSLPFSHFFFLFLFFFPWSVSQSVNYNWGSYTGFGVECVVFRTGSRSPFF